MNREERKLFLKFSRDFEFYASRCLKIRPKTGSIAPFILNNAQRILHDKIEQQKEQTGQVRAVLLKGRQQGCSTYVAGRFYWITTHRKGYKTFIIAHLSSATDNLFKMVKRYHELCPTMMRASTSTTNKKELVFDILDSGYGLGTAGEGNVGRSDTIQLLHGSEVAFWKNTSEIATGVMQTIPNLYGTEIILESTANGMGNLFYNYWEEAQSGASDYINIFIPWYVQDEYREDIDELFSLTSEEREYKEQFNLDDNQILWRRKKISGFKIDGSSGIWRFRQEYPATSSEAFQTSTDDSLLDAPNVLRARKLSVSRSKSPIIVGVDPARFGHDRTCIVKRCGRTVYDLEYHKDKDNMQVAGICLNILKHSTVDRMFIDVGGLGAGVVDRLRELGYSSQITAVNFGEKALNIDRYSNKRSEMWGELSAWLNEGECSLPDSDELHMDLLSLQYSYDSNGRLVLESKDSAKRRGMRSPDGGDAIALTFAYPVAPKGSNQSGTYFVNTDFAPIGF